MPTQKSKSSNGGASTVVIEPSANPDRERVFGAFRQWGYLEGDLDPLGFLRPRPTVELQIDSPYTAEARAIYSSTIGVEIKKSSNEFSISSSAPTSSSKSCSSGISAANASRSKA